MSFAVICGDVMIFYAATGTSEGEVMFILFGNILVNAETVKFFHRYKIDGDSLYWIGIKFNNGSSDSILHREDCCCPECLMSESFKSEECLEKRFEELCKLLGAKIDSSKYINLDIINTPLTARIKYCLILADIKTVGDLIKLSEHEVNRIPNIGIISLRAIKEYLNSIGLCLKEK